MRTILFRGKRIDNGEWIEGSLVMVFDGETLKRYPCIVISYNHDTFDWYEVDPTTVGQFTGLHGFDMIKIFEHSKCIYHTRDGSVNGVIIYEPQACAFWFKYSDGGISHYKELRAIFSDGEIYLNTNIEVI